MASDQQVLARALAAGFEADRLGALGWTALNAAALPALVLWIDSTIHLPATLVWLALVSWPASVALAAASGALASRVRRRYEDVQSQARGLARLHFSAGAPSPSAAFASLAAVLGAGIWLDAIAPRLVAPEVMAVVRVGWAALVAATLAARTRELAA